MMLGERVMAMRVSVTVAAGVIVLMLAAVPTVLMTGCGGSGEQTAGGAPGPGSGISGMETHEIGPMVVQTEKTGAFKAEAIPAYGDCTLLAFTGAQINYLASTALMDRFVFCSDRGSSGFNLYTCNFDGSNVVRLTNNAAIEEFPRWSPDGTRIVFGRQWPGENERICTINADGTGTKALTDGTRHATYPSWSPDGGQIAYMANMGSGDHDLWIMHAADGSNAVNITSSDADERYPAWSPDGSQMMYVSDAPGTYQIMTVGFDDVVTQLTDDHNDYATPVWHPRGWSIAFATERHGVTEVELMDLWTIKQRNFTSSPSKDMVPRFSSDGRYICYTSDRSSNWDIWVQENYLSEQGLSMGEEFPGPIRAYQVTKNPGIDAAGDMGSPTIQTARVLIGEPGTDLFGNDPVYPTAPAAIVALDDKGYRNMVRIGVAAAHLAGMQIKPLAESGYASAAVEVSATKVANLRQDGGLGRPPQVWDLNALNAGMVILHFNANTGKLSSIIPIQETAYTSGAGTDSQPAPYSAVADGDGMRLTGAFAAVFDAEGRNLAPSGASSVRLGSDGQVLAAN
jgi:Tol biopolymer transport system component